MPASRSARATTSAPRSCPSRPGLATNTRILRSVILPPERGLVMIILLKFWLRRPSTVPPRHRPPLAFAPVLSFCFSFLLLLSFFFFILPHCNHPVTLVL